MSHQIFFVIVLVPYLEDMYLEYFNGWQQLDLDTNLNKSTSTL
jgi:hypothetical protein